MLFFCVFFFFFRVLVLNDKVYIIIQIRYGILVLIGLLVAHAYISMCTLGALFRIGWNIVTNIFASFLLVCLLLVFPFFLFP